MAYRPIQHYIGMTVKFRPNMNLIPEAERFRNQGGNLIEFDRGTRKSLVRFTDGKDSKYFKVDLWDLKFRQDGEWK